MIAMMVTTAPTVMPKPIGVSKNDAETLGRSMPNSIMVQNSLITTLFIEMLLKVSHPLRFYLIVFPNIIFVNKSMCMRNWMNSDDKDRSKNHLLFMSINSLKHAILLLKSHESESFKLDDFSLSKTGYC